MHIDPAQYTVNIPMIVANLMNEKRTLISHAYTLLHAFCLSGLADDLHMVLIKSSHCGTFDLSSKQGDITGHEKYVHDQQLAKSSDERVRILVKM